MHILRAASRQFAHKTYSAVSLDDILGDAEVTKGAMYFHFRSKYALALAIIEYRGAVARASVDQLLAQRRSGLETLIDISYFIAVEDISDETARAALNLLECIGRTDNLAADVLGRWVSAFADFAREAIEEGDITQEHEPDSIARLLVSTYLGLRQTTDLSEPEQFLRSLERVWAMLLPGFAEPNRIGYLSQFVTRRTAVAIKRLTPLLAK
jgi:AcrR family transcriptional regulator